MTDPVQDGTADPVQRDRVWEAEFRKHLAADCEARSGFDATPLLEMAARRFDQGAEVYGDASFLTDDRDLIRELRAELADGINYVQMDLQRAMASERDDPERVSHLYELALYLCIADAHARAAARRGGHNSASVRSGLTDGDAIE